MTHDLLPLLTNLICRTTLLLTVIGGMTYCLRSQSAALRHWIWGLGLMSVLLMPFLMTTAPNLSVAVFSMPPQSSDIIRSAPASKTSVDSQGINGPSTDIDYPAAEGHVVSPPTTSEGLAEPYQTFMKPRAFNVSWIILGVWGLGALVILCGTVYQFVRIQPIARKGFLALEHPWMGEIRRISQNLGVSRTIHVLVSDDIAVPMTWGVFRPVIVLPDSSQHWSDKQRYTILLHEIAHIRRRDVLVNLLAVIPLAVYWFHPLIWFAIRRLKAEAENACDDVILAQGVSRHQYASCLVDIASNVISRKRLSIGVSILATKSELRRRIERLFTPSLNHGRLRSRDCWGVTASLSCFLLLISTISFVPAQAQTSIHLTVSLPERVRNAVADDVVGEFEAQHPGVDVIYSAAPDPLPFLERNDVNSYLDVAREMMNGADVVFVEARSLSPEMTQTGYLFDVQPLISTDPAFDADAFHTSQLRSFAWDGGQWALPVGGTLQVLLYDRAAFDQAGLIYPDTNWTIEQLATAAEKLALRNANGQVIQPGFAASRASALMLRALAGQSIYPTGLSMTDPQVVNLLTAWSTLFQSRLIESGYLNTPFRIGSFSDLSALRMERESWEGALLPGGAAGWDVGGFAISAASAHPELAYELITFLVSADTSANRLFYEVPSHKALPFVSNEMIQRTNLDNDDLILETQALSAALPASEILQFEYLVQVSDEADPTLALAEAQEQAANNLALAQQRRGTEIMTVSQPEPTPVLGRDEVTLRVYRYSTFPAWDDAVTDFVAQDAQVGQIVLVDSSGLEQGIDCGVTPNAPLGKPDDLLNLDPLMRTDVNFDEADIFPGLLKMSQVDGLTLSYPLAFSPSMLMYDRASFDQMGLPYPSNDWEMSDFLALLQMASSSSGGMPVLGSGAANDYLQPLIAGYGGLPVDFTTSPPTINLTQPQTMEAIRQVLDLAKNGYVVYRPMPEPYASIYTTPGEHLLWPGDTDFNAIFSEAGMVLYPEGTDYRPLAIIPIVGFIQQRSLYADACYRWLSYLTQRPDVVGLPARMSQSDEYAALSGYGERAIALYNAMLERASQAGSLQRSHTPSQIYSGFFEIQLRTQQAYDAYVLQDIPLDTALFNAEQDIQAFIACISDIPPLADLALMSDFEVGRYDTQYKTCVRTHIPAAAWMYGG